MLKITQQNSPRDFLGNFLNPIFTKLDITICDFKHQGSSVPHPPFVCLNDPLSSFFCFICLFRLFILSLHAESKE